MVRTTVMDGSEGLVRGQKRDNRAGSGIDKLDEILVGYDSQYEDGELRESTINAWKGYSSDEVLSGSEPKKMIGGQEESGRQDIVQLPAASQSDEWKMNVSRSDLLPENGYAPSLSSLLGEQKPPKSVDLICKWRASRKLKIKRWFIDKSTHFLLRSYLSPSAVDPHRK
ncbi:hypothetical protein L1987_47042 [Smallanthus sonchifolius]|uniref:Uncharacterized protein n=1 Tax=Smallanthus sonchifolius TaxID=185202 RepID=A0ACB9G1H3_9ASTR|nr:hypothetical protein L1987_47042 [Smallanthus sonchifolius]